MECDRSNIMSESCVVIYIFRHTYVAHSGDHRFACSKRAKLKTGLDNAKEANALKWPTVNRNVMQRNNSQWKQRC